MVGNLRMFIRTATRLVRPHQEKCLCMVMLRHLWFRVSLQALVVARFMF